MTPGLESALGDGWLGKLLLGLLTLVFGGLGGWFMRRPLEQAGVLAAVNARLEAFMRSQEKTLEDERAAHARCEQRIEALEAHRERDRQEIDLLRGQLNQEKQVAASIIRLAEKSE